MDPGVFQAADPWEAALPWDGQQGLDKAGMGMQGTSF